MRALFSAVAFAAACLVSLPAGAAHAQDFRGKPEQPVVVQPPLASLPVGETLSYSIEWLGFPVGKIILKVEDIEDVNGRKCYHVLARSFPNNYIRKLYDVDYQVHSYIDVEHRYPVRFLKVRRMRKQFNHVLIDFDQEAGKASYRTWGGADFVDFAKRGDKKNAAAQPTEKIVPGTQDLLSSFFYFRFHPFVVGTSYPVNVYYDMQNWTISMYPKKTLRREIRNKGTFPSVDVYISSTLNDFIFGKEKFHVLLTADEHRIPVEFKVGTALGPIRGIIENASAKH